MFCSRLLTSKACFYDGTNSRNVSFPKGYISEHEDVQIVVQALQEAEVFRQKHDEFGTEMARRAAIDPKTSPCKSNFVHRYCFSIANFKYIG
jgi:hypothetical protein